MVLSVRMSSTVSADVPLDSSGDDRSIRRFRRNMFRVQQRLRCIRIVSTAFLSCVPLFVARRPKTPLRVLCIAAFEYLARLRGASLDDTHRLALAYACDFGALRNDFYDQRELDRHMYRELRHGLRRLAQETATRRYIVELRKTERARPVFGPDGFAETASVLDYRLRVLVLSLAWLHIVSRRSIEPGIFQALVALVGLIQLVDDLFDWKDDWACRRPTCVTAFLRNWTGPSRESGLQIQLHANRFRGLLLANRDLETAPLVLAGTLMWLLAIALTKIRFPR